MARSRRRRVLRSIGGVTALAAVVGGSVALDSWKPFASEEVDVAPVWADDDVERLVRYVERVGGLTFTDAMDVRFFDDPDDYDAAVAELVSVAPPPDQADADAVAAFGRAIGLWGAEYDPVASGDGRFNTDVALADDLSAVLINDEDLDDPLIRVVTVGALTYAAQLQTIEANGGLDPGYEQPLRALQLLQDGHARYVQDRYVADFDDDEREEFEQILGVDEVDPVGRPEPPVSAFFYERSALGAMFVTALAETDRDLVVAAFADPPTGYDQMLVPSERYLDRDLAEPLDPLPVPDDAELVQWGQLGVVDVFFMLSSVLPAYEAFAAALGWGNDQYVAYTVDGQVCADLAIVADSDADADRLFAGLSTWVATRPEASRALVGRDGNQLAVSSCDPGVTEPQLLPAADALDHLRAYLYFMRTDLDDSVDLAEAECVWTAMFTQFTAADIDVAAFSLGDDFFDPPASEAIDELERQRDDCD